MSYRYEKLYIMHYGVGHDKGGHSGRYPWGSGKNPYGGVDPTTKKTDLFKLNGRKFNDVASDLIVKKKYGNRTDVTEEQIARSKARTQAFLKGAEATIGAALLGSVGSVSYDLLSKADFMERNIKAADYRIKHYVDAQQSIIDFVKNHEDLFDTSTRQGRLNLDAAQQNASYNGPFMHPSYQRNANDLQLRMKHIDDLFKTWDKYKGYYKVPANA